MPAAKKTSKAKKNSSKAKKTATPAPVAEPVVEVSAPAEPPVVVDEGAPAPSTSTESDSGNTLDTLFAEYNKKLSELRSLEASLVSDFKKLQKATMRHLKEMSKKNKKRKLTDEEKKKCSKWFCQANSN